MSPRTTTSGHSGDTSMGTSPAGLRGQSAQSSGALVAMTAPLSRRRSAVARLPIRPGGHAWAGFRAAGVMVTTSGDRVLSLVDDNVGACAWWRASRGIRNPRMSSGKARPCAQRRRHQLVAALASGAREAARWPWGTRLPARFALRGGCSCARRRGSLGGEVGRSKARLVLGGTDFCG
jgi:hypothetical protein